MVEWLDAVSVRDLFVYEDSLWNLDLTASTSLEAARTRGTPRLGSVRSRSRHFVFLEYTNTHVDVSFIRI